MAYTSKNSVLRANRLQSLCESLNLSSLVFILGIDSKRNRLDEQLYYWLFHGFSGYENLSSVSLPLSDEEICFIVTPSAYHIFIGSACNDVKSTFSLFSYIEEISLSWAGVHLTTLTKEEIQDSELAENTKLLWFNRTMSKILGPVGICSSEIETWPLIQGYAIDLFGLGFFSMSHPPKEISSEINSLFYEFDDAGIMAVLNEHLPRLVNVFQQTIDFVNKRNYSAGRGELTESAIAECVTLPFEYATIQSNKEHMVSPEYRLYGYENTRKLHSAHHMTVMAVCGVSGILCARSWFLVPSGGFKGFISQYEEEDDIKGLMQVYQIIISAVRTALQGVSSIDQIKEKIFLEIFKSRTLFKYHHMLEAVRKAKIEFFSHDADGKTVLFNENLPVHSLLFRAANISSQDFGNLGDLVFGESFVIKGGLLTIITESVKDLVLWESQTKRPWQSAYGEKLSQIENVELYIEEFGLFTGTLLIYESGWAFRSIHIGQLEYSIEEFTSIEQHGSELLSFFTETLQIVIKIPTRSSFVLVSIWKIKDVETDPLELPVSKKIVIPYLTKPQHAQVREDLIPVYFITGIAGSGKTKAAKDIAKGLKVDLVMAPLELSPGFDRKFWSEALGSINRQCLVLLPSYLCVYDFLEFLPASCYVRSVICKVSSKNVYSSKRKTKNPALMHLIYSCNSLILEEGNEEFCKTVGMINTDMEVFRVNGAIGPSQARNIANVDRPVPVQKGYIPDVPLQSVFVKIPLPLVENKIKARLANSEITDDGPLPKRINWQHDMEIIRVKGVVEYYIKEKEFFDISGNSRYLSSTPSESSDSGILFIGRNLDLNKLYEFVLDCRSHVNKIPLKTRKGLTPSEVELVEKNLSENSEYIFDGTHYVDSLGKRFKVNPDLEQALLDYVDQENDRIGSINRAVEKESAILKKANSNTQVQQVFP